MADQKPRIKLSVLARPPAVDPVPETPYERARRRHGKPFAHEAGSEFKSRPAPWVLEKWLRGRGK